MKFVMPVLVACSLLLAPTMSGAAQTTAPSKSGQASPAFRVTDGPDAALFVAGPNGGEARLGALRPVQGSRLRFAAVPLRLLEKEKLAGLVKPGFYIVTPDSRVIRFMEKQPSGETDGLVELVDLVTQMAMSPDGKILVLAAKPSAVGTLLFYSWPDMQPLKGATFSRYFQTDPTQLVRWVNNTEVAVELFDEADNRVCAQEPCGDLSVFLFNPVTGTSAAVVYGSDMCTYTIKSVAADRITVGRTCMRDPQDWKDYNPAVHTPSYVTIPLPVRETR